MSAVECRELRKVYRHRRRGDVPAVRDLSLNAEAAEVFALVGPNGAGKTTTSKMLTALTRPDAGTARVMGHDVVAAAPQVRRVIGYSAQDSGLDRFASVEENIELLAELHGLRGRERRQRLNEPFSS